MPSSKSHNVQPTPEPPFHVVACDLDGSLLNEHHEVTDFTRKTIQRLIEAYRLPEPGGAATTHDSLSATSATESTQYRVFFILASGRHVTDIASILDKLELPDFSGYIVSANGARAHCMVRHVNSSHAATDNTPGSQSGNEPDAKPLSTGGGCLLREVFSSSLLPSQVRRLLSLVPVGDESINVNVYRDDGWYCSLDWMDELQYYKSGFAYRIFKPQEWMDTYDAFVKSELERSVRRHEAFTDLTADDHPLNPLRGIQKIFFGSDDTDRISGLARVMRNEVSEMSDEPLPADAATAPGRFRVTATFSSKYCIEGTAEGVTKASGINHLMSYLQNRSDSVCDWTMSGTCIAFGDGDNDEMMLRSAACGCLMANSNPQLRERLASVPTIEVVGPNTSDGIAHKLIEVFRLNHGERNSAHEKA